MERLFELGLVFMGVGMIAMGLVIFISMLAVMIDDYLSDLCEAWLREFIKYMLFWGVVSLIVSFLIMSSDFIKKLWVLL